MNCLNVFKNVGLLNIEKVTTADGTEVVPLHVLKACLPDPASLAATYTGKTCIATLINGTKDNKPKEVIIYNICDHEETYSDVDSQAIAFTAGVPPVAAAILIAKGDWDVKKMKNVEELKSKPFLAELEKLGISTEITTLSVKEKLALGNTMMAKAQSQTQHSLPGSTDLRSIFSSINNSITQQRGGTVRGKEKEVEL